MKKVFLCIMDGVGIRKNSLGNAYLNAKTPYLDYLMQEYPHTYIFASGEHVGLPKGQMGNSEVGHSTIGSGRIIYQSLEKINQSIKNETFFNNLELLSAINHAKKNGSKLHLIGLLSDGGIHSDIKHLFALLEMCSREEFHDVYIHVITDGRDTAIDSGKKYIKLLEDKLQELGFGHIASLCGRYYMMDRDNNYDRVKRAYDLLVLGNGTKYESAILAWEDNQNRGITDEFMEPSLIDCNGLVNSYDAIITFNFRPDRLRELYTALSNSLDHSFERKILNNLKVVTMMPVDKGVKCTNAFEYENLDNVLGEVIDKNNLTQLRIAETEKYAHVTYFFDGGRELKLNKCKKILIPSKKVATYDLVPEMSAYEITDELIKELVNKPDLIVLNFANGDMVGHTGVYEMGIRAVSTVDSCLKEIISHIDLSEYTVIITADHGNCEQMINDDGTVNTAHTTNKVPLIIMDKELMIMDSNIYSLRDIAPTILKIMGLSIPKEMDGSVMISSE